MAMTELIVKELLYYKNYAIEYKGLTVFISTKAGWGHDITQWLGHSLWENPQLPDREGHRCWRIELP